MQPVPVGFFTEFHVTWSSVTGVANIRLSSTATGELLAEFPLTSVQLWDIYAGTIEEPVPVPLLAEDAFPELAGTDIPSIDDLDFPPDPRYTR
jgi:hypothetical protein